MICEKADAAPNLFSAWVRHRSGQTAVQTNPQSETHSIQAAMREGKQGWCIVWIANTLSSPMPLIPSRDARRKEKTTKKWHIHASIRHIFNVIASADILGFGCWYKQKQCELITSVYRPATCGSRISISRSFASKTDRFDSENHSPPWIFACE